MCGATLRRDRPVLRWTHGRLRCEGENALRPREEVSENRNAFFPWRTTPYFLAPSENSGIRFYGVQLKFIWFPYRRRWELKENPPGGIFSIFFLILLFLRISADFPFSNDIKYGYFLYTFYVIYLLFDKKGLFPIHRSF